jgi:hypothetical protein
MLSNCTVILLYGGGVGGLGFPAPFLPLIEHIRRSYYREWKPEDGAEDPLPTPFQAARK